MALPRRCWRRPRRKTPRRRRRNSKGLAPPSNSSSAFWFPVAIVTATGNQKALLEFDGGANPFELRLRLLGVFLLGLLQHRLGSAIYQVLGFFQPETGQRAHLFDDLDLRVPGGNQDHVELILLVLAGTSVAATGRGCGRYGDRSCRGYAKTLLELLEQFAQFENGQLRDAIQNLVLGQGACHCYCSL